VKGIVFNLLEEVVTRTHGEHIWDALLDAAELSGSYTSLGSYPDEQRYPTFFLGHQSSRPFIVSVNQIIHPEVRKLYAGADVPVFDFSDGPDGALMLGYRSPRKLCALAQGFIEGAAAHFHESVAVEHQTCMHDGDAECRMRLSFSTNGAG
jgi:glycine cleavage system aminomethyltransferase T